MPVLVRPVMHANGESEVVGIFLSKHEDSATLQELFSGSLRPRIRVGQTSERR